MANPSLQIGNSNWAIKEDDLLGYSTVGTNYLPKPMTMTRESAGTRVNPQGLVETVELLGSEEIEDGGFPTPNTAWDVFNGATISGGKANIVGDGSAFGYISQSSVFTNGKTYKVTLDAVITSGGGLSVKYSTAYADNIGFITTTGSYTFYYTATSDYNLVIGRTQSGVAYDSSVTNVSVKESTKNNLARVDYDGTASSLLVEPERTNLITTSEDFDSYRIAGSTVTPNSTTAPDGTNSGILVTQGVSTLVLRASNVVAPSTTYTFSGYFKSSSSVTQVTLDITDSGNTTFDLTSEWQRFSITAESRPGGSPYHFVDVATNGIQGDTFYAWGLQLEEASYGTSYIPTSGNTVTRVQDQYSKTGISNLINSEEGVLFAEIAALSESNLNSYITIGQNNSTGILGISFYTGSNNILLDHWSGGASETYHLQSMSDVTEFNKIAICYNGTSIKGYINGSLVWNTTVTTWSSNALSELNFAFGSNGGNKFLGKVKQLQIFKTALTDSELIALTS